MPDFLERIQSKNLNKKSLESLIKSGALDDYEDRGLMLENLETLLGYHKENIKQGADQENLFGLMSDTSSVPKLRLSGSRKATIEEKLAWEKELLGLYLSGHPLDKFKEKLKERKVNIKRVKTEFPEGLSVAIIGILENIREVITKRNEKMVFGQISDLSDSIEIVCFPKTYIQIKDILQSDNCVALVGTVSKRRDETSLVVEKIKKI